MPNYNHLELIGHLCQDPQLSFTPNQTAVCQGSIAETETWYGQDKQKHEDTLFIGYVIFGKQAETFNKYHSKGDPVMLIGKLALDQWEDKETGQKRQRHKMKVERFVFMPRKDKSASDGGSPAMDRDPDIPF